jgi:hypothetical protein
LFLWCLQVGLVFLQVDAPETYTRSVLKHTNFHSSHSAFAFAFALRLSIRGIYTSNHTPSLSLPSSHLTPTPTPLAQRKRIRIHRTPQLNPPRLDPRAHLCLVNHDVGAAALLLLQHAHVLQRGDDVVGRNVRAVAQLEHAERLLGGRAEERAGQRLRPVVRVGEVAQVRERWLGG